MGIVDEDIVRVRDATDIVAVISQKVALRRVGRGWSGLCPFHDEKSPSFSVSAEKGVYYCFGCQKSGDGITFVQETEQLDFQGAVEFLAHKANISLRYTSPDETGQRARRRTLTDLVERAVEFYHERLLTGADAGDARRYLRNRGFDGEMVRRYRLGWAPDDWDQLARHLKASDKDLEASGVGRINKRGRQQDWFRGRVLFPIFDPSGDAIGFGGRIMPGETGPKYINTSDCAVYHKGRVLYGLNWAKDAIVRHRRDGEVTGEAIVCEGYTDVIAFDRAGVGRAVATCGTALTEDHVRLLRRFAGRIVLAFDADEAGQGAAARFYEWERKYELEVAVADLPAGVDPDELSRTAPERLQAAVTGAVPFLAFRVARVLDRADLATPERRARAAESAIAAVREHPNPLVRDQYVMQIGDRCQVAPDRLRAMLEAPARSASGSTGRARGRDDQRGSGATRKDDAPPPGDGDEWAPSDADATGQHQPGRGRGRAGGRSTTAGRTETEDEALRWLMIDASRIAPLLDRALFESAQHADAYVALGAASDVHAALAAATPEVADLVRRLATGEPHSDPTEVAARLADLSAMEMVASLEREARSVTDLDDLKEFTTAIAWLKRQVELVRESTTRDGALALLVPWLVQHSSGTVDV